MLHQDLSAAPLFPSPQTPAVARGPTYQAWSEVTRHKNEQWSANQFSIFLFVVTWGSVAQL